MFHINFKGYIHRNWLISGDPSIFLSQSPPFTLDSLEFFREKLPSVPRVEVILKPNWGEFKLDTPEN